MQIAYNVMWKKVCYDNVNCLQCNVEKSLLRQCKLLTMECGKKFVTTMQIAYNVMRYMYMQFALS
jgi:hypothetical protein